MNLPALPAAVTNNAVYGFITNNIVTNTMTSLFAKYVGFVAKFTGAAAAPWLCGASVVVLTAVAYKNRAAIIAFPGKVCSYAASFFPKKTEGGSEA